MVRARAARARLPRGASSAATSRPRSWRARRSASGVRLADGAFAAEAWLPLLGAPARDNAALAAACVLRAARRERAAPRGARARCARGRRAPGADRAARPRAAAHRRRRPHRRLGAGARRRAPGAPAPAHPPRALALGGQGPRGDLRGPRPLRRPGDPHPRRRAEVRWIPSRWRPRSAPSRRISRCASSRTPTSRSAPRAKPRAPKTWCARRGSVYLAGIARTVLAEPGSGRVVVSKR